MSSPRGSGPRSGQHSHHHLGSSTSGPSAHFSTGSAGSGSSPMVQFAMTDTRHTYPAAYETEEESVDDVLVISGEETTNHSHVLFSHVSPTQTSPASSTSSSSENRSSHHPRHEAPHSYHHRVEHPQIPHSAASVSAMSRNNNDIELESGLTDNGRRRVPLGVKWVVEQGRAGSLPGPLLATSSSGGESVPMSPPPGPTLPSRASRPQPTVSTSSYPPPAPHPPTPRVSFPSSSSPRRSRRKSSPPVVLSPPHRGSPHSTNPSNTVSPRNSAASSIQMEPPEQKIEEIEKHVASAPRYYDNDVEDEDRDDTSRGSTHRVSLQGLSETHRRALLKRTFSLVPERFGLSSGGSGLRGGLRRGPPSRTAIILCEYALKALSILLLVLFFPLSMFVCIKIVVQYERAVIFRLGKLMSQDACGPGLIFYLPCIDSMKKVDLRTFTFDVPTQEVLTSDSVTVAVDAVVYYRIFDPVMSVVNVEEANRSTRLLAQTTLRNVLGTVDLSYLLADRENIANMMQETLDAATDTWGVKVERVEVKDVRLPIQLQRAMAAEAEATRESKAKVIVAEGERGASRALRLAAEEISLCPVALQLRYLQTLNTISAEKNSTIIFPMPTDLLTNFISVHNNVAHSSEDRTEHTSTTMCCSRHRIVVREQATQTNSTMSTMEERSYATEDEDDDKYII